MKKGLLLLVSILFCGVSAMAQQEVQSITLDSEAFDLGIGDSHTLNPTVLPAEANQTVTWETSDVTIATVTGGVVTAIREGQATITAKADGGKTASCVVTVKTTVPVETISITPADITLIVGEEEQLDVTVLPVTASDKTVSWSNTDPTVATVDPTTGKVKALAGGSTTIKATATSGVASNDCTIKVKVITKITIPATLSLNFGDPKVTLTPSVEPTTATGYTLTWHSDNTNVATVDSNGDVTAKGGGKANITASASDDDVTSNVCVVEVKVPATEVRIDQEGPITLAVGEKKTLTATIKPTNTTSKVTWTSNNGTVAEINASTGEVTAKSKGSATITATADGKISTCDFEIVDPVNVTGIKFDKTTLNLNVDSVATLTASFTPSNASNKAVTFTSSDGSIVEITSITQDTIIKIKALKTGTANITVKTADGNKTATCKITVPAVLVTKVKLDKNSIPSLLIGDSVTLKATITPTNASNQKVTWKSDNTKIATVSDDGKVKGIAAGKTFIVVSSSNDKVKDTCTVEVKAVVVPVTGVKFRKDTINIIEKDTIRLIADILPASATNKNLNWVSKNEDAVTVSNTGIIKGIKAGQSLIIVSTQNNDKKDTCVVNVRERVLIIDPEVSAQGSKGSIPLSLNVPDKETITGTFTIKFPAGVKLDIENTKLTEAFAAASSLSITPGSNNTWKVEIKKKDLKSMLRALSNQKVMDIAYEITKNVKKGDLLDVNIENAEFKFTDNTVIKEEGMTFKLKADYTTSNDLISRENGYAYKSDNRLFIQSPKAETIYVYTFGGALLYSKDKTEGEASFDLNVQEPVIVKGSSGWTQKVAK